MSDARAFIVVTADMPAGEAQSFLQQLRAFDTTTPGCHFRIVIAAPDQTTEEAEAILRAVDPPFADIKVVRAR